MAYRIEPGRSLRYDVTVRSVLQGWGHAREVNAPVPFSGPGNFLRRWFLEQIVIFPLFLLTGRWRRPFNGAGGGTGNAA